MNGYSTAQGRGGGGGQGASSWEGLNETGGRRGRLWEKRVLEEGAARAEDLMSECAWRRGRLVGGQQAPPCLEQGGGVGEEGGGAGRAEKRIPSVNAGAQGMGALETESRARWNEHHMPTLEASCSAGSGPVGTQLGRAAL